MSSDPKPTAAWTHENCNRSGWIGPGEPCPISEDEARRSARSDDAHGYEAEIRRNYTMVCRCEWEDHGYDEVIVATSRDCVIHGDVDDPLLTLMGSWNQYRDILTEIKRLASDPFASETVALRACLLAANEALGFPGPEPSPERDIARAIIKEIEADATD